MRAVVAREYGPPEVLRVEELPEPVAGPGQVRVRVHAAAVNFPDVLVLANRYQVSAPLPLTPGSEFAGEVVSCGPGAPRFRAGARVYGAALTGAFAEEIVAPEGSLSLLPEGVRFTDAAAFSVAYTTAWGALVSTAALRSGETLLVLGAAGGVGLAAVELGCRLGARVLAVASSEEKRALCLARGAALALDAEPSGLRERLRAAVGREGVDVVLDPVGGALSEPALRSLAQRGRHVVVGFAAGEIPRLPANLLLLRNSRLLGFELGGWRRRELEAARRADETLLAWLAAGRLTPHIGGRFPLARVAEALALVSSRRALGKLLIEPGLRGPEVVHNPSRSVT